MRTCRYQVVVHAQPDSTYNLYVCIDHCGVCFDVAMAAMSARLYTSVVFHNHSTLSHHTVCTYVYVLHYIPKWVCRYMYNQSLPTELAYPQSNFVLPALTDTLLLHCRLSN